MPGGGRKGRSKKKKEEGRKKKDRLKPGRNLVGKAVWPPSFS